MAQFSGGRSPATFLHQEGCVIQDLTVTPAGYFYLVRQVANQRSLPSSVLPLLPTKGEEAAPRIASGDTVLIIPEEFAAAAGPWGYVLEPNPRPLFWADIPAATTSLRNWKSYAALLARRAQDNLRLNPQDLPDSLTASRYLRRGYLLDAALARRLDEIDGLGGFLDAVRQSWALVLRQSSRNLTPRQKDAIIIFYVQKYIARAQADHDGGFREDNVAEYVRKEDPAEFGTFNATKLGKVFARRDIGTTHLRGFYEKSRRIFRTVIYLSEDDKRQMESIARELST